jgi:hypothetical protein
LLQQLVSLIKKSLVLIRLKSLVLIILRNLKCLNPTNSIFYIKRKGTCIKSFTYFLFSCDDNRRRKEDCEDIPYLVGKGIRGGVIYLVPSLPSYSQ